MNREAYQITMEEKREIGKRVKEIRDARNLSQREFAEILDRAQNQISRIENGENLITSELLLILHKLYDIDIQYVLTGKTSNGVVPEISPFVSWCENQEHPETRSGVARFCEAIMDAYNAKPTGE